MMKNLNKIVSTGLFAEAIVFASQAHAGAILGWGANDARPNNVPVDLQAAIMNITNWILGFIAIVATLIVIYGGLLYLTAAGNDDQVGKAKKTISSGIIGVAICGLAYALVYIVSHTIITAGTAAA